MVIYEVTQTVRADLCGAYERFIVDRHVPDVLATGIFLGASLGRSTPGRYRIRYEALDRYHVDRYLAEHSLGLSEQVLAAFPSGVESAREEWEILARFAES